MQVTKFLKPKSSGSTVVNNYGFASTSSNSGGSSSVTVSGDVITASQVDVTDTLTATQGIFQSLTASQGNIVNLSSSSASISNLSVSQNATFNGNITSYATTDQYGDLTTHGNVTFASSPQYGNAFDFTQVVSYMGSHNYFDELIGGEGSTMSVESINADYLTVNKSAHFFELVIDKIKAAGGCALFTPADGFTIDKIELESGTSYAYIYWRACSEVSNETEGTLLEDAATPPTESVTANMWREDDQALCQSFNLTDGAGTYQDISNKYWWTLVRLASEQPKAVTIDGGNQYWMHWIKVYAADDSGQNIYMAQGSGTPEVGDTVSMLGNRTDTTRQGAIVISAYPTYMDRGDDDHIEMRAPYFAEYTGVNNFNLASHRKNWIAANSTTLQGDIRLTSGDSIEDYVNDKISDIQTGDQFYTNVLTFSNQNINVPASSTGVPVTGNYYTYLYAMHGNNTLTITSIRISNSSDFTISGINTREGCITLRNVNTTSLPADQNIFDVTVQATTGGTSPATITYDAKLFINKIKDGQKGADGLTPIIYELASTSTSRSWLTNAATPYATPSSVTIRVNAIDQSKTTDKISNISSLPSGMSLWYRTYNHNTSAYSGYQNVSSNYSYYYTISPGASTPYSLEVYLNVQPASDTSFNASKIYDSISIPLIYAGKNGTDGTNGTNGTNGENGTNVSVDMTSMKASVSKTDVLTMSLVGKLLWREGDMVDANHDWTGYKIDVTNDNNYQTGTNSKRPANAMRQEGITVTASNGQFSWQPASISQYHSYNYSYRPTTLYVNVKDGSSYTVASFNVPVTFEAGATLDITNEINAIVTANTGEITTLKITAQGLRTDVDNNAGDISTLQHTATGIQGQISNMQGDITTLQATATGISTRITNAEGNISSINQTVDNISLSVEKQSNLCRHNLLSRATFSGNTYAVGQNNDFDYINKTNRNSGYYKSGAFVTNTATWWANLSSNISLANWSDDEQVSNMFLFNTSNTRTLNFSGELIPAASGSPNVSLQAQIKQDIIQSATTKDKFTFSIYVKRTTDREDVNTVKQIYMQASNMYIDAFGAVPIDGANIDNITMNKYPSSSTLGTSTEGAYFIFNTTDEWYRIYITGHKKNTNVTNSNALIRIYGQATANKGNDFYIKDPKVEEGTVMTPWTPGYDEDDTGYEYSATDNELKRTGIDIEDGKIVLQADNTIINGDLDLKGRFTSEKSSEWRKVLIDAEEGDIVIYGPSSFNNKTPQGPYKKMLQIGNDYDENEVAYGTLIMGTPNDQDGQLSNPNENSNNWNTCTEIIQGNGGLDTIISQVSPNNRTRIMPNSITQENYNWDVNYDQSNLQSAGLDIQHYTATGTSGARLWKESHHFSVGADGLAFVKDVDYIDPTPINIRPIYTTSGTNRISGRMTLTSYNASNTQTNNVELSPEGVYLYYSGSTHFKSWADIMGLN